VVNNSKKILEGLGYDIEDAIAKDAALTKARSKSPYVCLCGHPVSSHTPDPEDESKTVCKPTRMWCHCTSLNPVLKVQDTRKFYRKTNSYGVEHALIRGIVASMQADKNTEVIEERYKCMIPKCKVKGSSSAIHPVLVEYGLPNFPKGKLVKNHKFTKPSEYEVDLRDILMCQEHLDELVLRSIR
jgi:hypothetical protein